jgi:hypothetical protein
MTGDRPHYRDPDLTDDVAMQACTDAANHATREVLNARLIMLHAGIAVSHPLCRILDSFAEAMTYMVTHGAIVDPLPIIPFIHIDNEWTS